MRYSIMTRYRTLFIPLIVALASLLVPFSPSVRAAASVAPPQGTVGTRFNFVADGFMAGEPIDFWLTAPDGGTVPRYPSVDADNNGQVVWSWDAPAGAPNGVWRMTARGVKTDRRETIPFTIVGAGATPAPRSVTPPSGPPGTRFTFSAGGFNGNERVGTWLNGPDGRDIELSTEDGNPIWVADKDGQLIWTWASPETASGGSWRVLARGLSSNYQVVIPFTVTGPAASPPARNVTPPTGAPGTTFAFSAGGFNPGEQVGTWLNRPDGSRIDATPWLFADDKGQTSWTWASPADAPGGTWSAVARGFDSRVEVVINFTVTGSNTVPAAPTVTGSVAPSSGKAGTLFTFNAVGFRPGETIDYWTINPQSVPDPNFIQTYADGEGKATWTWTPTDRSAPGQWMMAARGQSTRLAVQISFTVLPLENTATPYSVSPASSGPGTTFRFTANGYNAIEWIEIWINTPDGKVLEGPKPPVDDPDHSSGRRNARADGQGTAQWDWTAPNDAIAGTWEMVARGVDSRILRTIPFTIVRDTPAQPAITASVNPPVGAPGTTFTFTANGYEEGERVGYWLTAPDSSITRFDQELVGDGKGTITWTWTAPADAPRGLWQMVARSSQSDKVQNDVQHIVRFTVQ